MQKFFSGLILLLMLLSFSTINSVSQTKNKVASMAEDICPVLVGTTIPDAILTTIDNEEVSLMNLVKEKPTVLIFYRGGWCPYCNAHLSELYDAEKELVKMGYQILAISMDKPEKLRESLEKTEINYTLLSDSKADAAIKFGLAFRVDDELNEKYKGYGIDLEAASGEEHHILPVPAAFVLDTEGNIHFSYVNPGYKTRVSIDVLIAAAKATLNK